jgi:hypothetical protein
MAVAHGLKIIPHSGQIHNLYVVMSSFASTLFECFIQIEIEVLNECSGTFSVDKLSQKMDN